MREKNTVKNNNKVEERNIHAAVNNWIESIHVRPFPVLTHWVFLPLILWRYAIFIIISATGYS